MYLTSTYSKANLPILAYPLLPSDLPTLYQNKSLCKDVIFFYVYIYVYVCKFP